MIADRALQALALSALEPEWEARLEPKSYSFRPGRGCHDAIVAIHTTAVRRDAKPLWVLDADLEAAFDRAQPSAHPHLAGDLPRPGDRSASGCGRKCWKMAGSPPGEGVPQGGVISLCLMNVALQTSYESNDLRLEYSHGRVSFDDLLCASATSLASRGSPETPGGAEVQERLMAPRMDQAADGVWLVTGTDVNLVLVTDGDTGPHRRARRPAGVGLPMHWPTVS